MALFLITAPSGVGKTFLSQEIAKYKDWAECVSTTTRAMRNGEENGKTYYFISQQKFNEMESENEFVESVRYDGNRYGITKNEIERVMNNYKNVFVIVEFDGYKQVKKLYPDAVGIFLHMSKEDCMANMLLRGDSLKKANARILTYDDEIKNRGEFDYVIKNVRGKQNETIAILRNVIRQYN